MFNFTSTNYGIFSSNYVSTFLIEECYFEGLTCLYGTLVRIRDDCII